MPAGSSGRVLVSKVISGGQDGADVAGLRAAKRLGLETGGWMPAGFRTLHGPAPQYEREFGVHCTAGEDYVARTRLNVMESDGTVRLAWDWASRGELATHRELVRAGKPGFDVTIIRSVYGDMTLTPPPEELREWLAVHGIRVLNVAGNGSHWIEEVVEEYLVAALGPVSSTVWDTPPSAAS